MTRTPSLQQLAVMLVEADRMMSSPSEARRAEGLKKLREVERHFPNARIEPEIECARCCRDRRSWFATGVAEQQLHPLCSRACVVDWRRVYGGHRVFMRDGREWQDQWGESGRANLTQRRAA